VRQGYDVICYCANVGQYKEDFEKVRQKAIKAGAIKVGGLVVRVIIIVVINVINIIVSIIIIIRIPHRHHPTVCS
jgi:argininosuccinate synthase